MGIPPGVQIDPDSVIAELKNADPVVAGVTQRIKDRLSELHLPPPLPGAIAVTLGSLLYTLVAVLGLVIKILADIASPLFVTFLHVLSQARKDTVEAQVQVAAEVLSEFLATDIPAVHLKTGKTADQTLEAARDIGARLHDRLVTEFAPDGKVTPDTGAKAARAFSGFAVNFGVQNAMLGQLAEATSFHYLEHIRDIGEETAKNLGLGRLQRNALGPLTENLIKKPYDRKLRAQYRQDLLAQSQYVQAYFAGRLDRAGLSDKLGQLGISEPDIDELILQLAPDFNQTDIVRLVRWGKLSIEQAVQLLQNQGWPKDYAQQRLGAALLARPDTRVDEFLGVLLSRRRDGFMPEEDFNKLLDEAPITEEERDWFRKVVGVYLEYPFKQVTFAQLTKALVSGIATWDDVDGWFEREHYDDASHTILEFELLQAIAKDASKKQIAAARVARATNRANGVSNTDPAIPAIP